MDSSLPGRPGRNVNRPSDNFWNLLDPADQRALGAIGQPGAFESGCVLCAEFEETTDVFVLFDGWVKIAAAAGGTRELGLGLRGSGDITGELAAETGYRTATIKAIAQVSALIVPHAEFTRFLDDHPRAARAFQHDILRRLSETTEMLRSRSVSSGPERLAVLLTDLGERYGTPGKGGTVISIPLSQREIASFIGASRSTVTRALGNWRKRGLVNTSRHRITIMNTTSLRRIAHKDPVNRKPPAA
jgi:CRP/FNR family transcriptional regulator, cyclic AMP receptor protein